jgi:hypothetical protein
MLGVAVGWQLYSLTGSALDLGLVGLVQFVPMVLLTLVVGQVPAVLLGGVGTIAVAGLWLIFFPELRRLGRFEE